MLQRALLVFFMVFLLGSVQQGAAAHAISHLADRQSDSKNDSRQDKSGHGLTYCGECAAHAALDGVIALPEARLPEQLQPAVAVDGFLNRHAPHTAVFCAARDPPCHS